MGHRLLLIYQQENVLLDVNGFSQSNIKQMEILRGLRSALWQKGLLNPMGLIIKKLSPLFICVLLSIAVN